MICAILTHFLNTTAADNYFVRAEGRWFRRYTLVKDLVPPAPLDTSPGAKVGPNTRLASGRPLTSC